MASDIDGQEELVRLLFTDRMTSAAGELEKEAFPVDELIENKGKSVSVDRMLLLSGLDQIKSKLITYENPNRGRQKWGFALGLVESVRSIISQQGERVFEVYADPLTSYPPAPWDHAHAKIVRANANFSKGFVRGYRDKLVDIFQEDVSRVYF